MSCRRRWLVGVSACVLAWSGGATATVAADERGIDPNQGENLVEVSCRARRRPSGCSSRPRPTASTSTSTTCASTPTARSPSRSSAPRTRSPRSTRPASRSGPRSRARAPGATASRRARPTCARSSRADDAALDEPVVTPRTHEDELVVLRVGLLRELRRPLPVGRGEDAAAAAPRRPAAVYIGPTLSLSWNSGAARRSTRRRGAMNSEHRPGHDAGHLHRAP